LTGLSYACEAGSAWGKMYGPRVGLGDVGGVGGVFLEATGLASVICYVAAVIGCVFALAAGLLARGFARSGMAAAKSFPSVTILKPLHGAEPGLFANLASFCVQDYPGPVQIVFGVKDRADAAVDVVHRLIAAFPNCEIELVVNSHSHGTNRKVSNLINLAAKARHDVLVLSDSDIIVEPDYLKNIVGVLDQPGVGLVTCLYRGVAARGPWARLAAAAINHHFLPAVLFGLRLGLTKPCFGSTIALRATTLAMIGGFNSVADQLADDYALGEMVRRVGLTVAIPSLTVVHACTHRTASDLFHHELRWARTIRFVDPLGFIGSVVTHAFPLALLGLLLGGITPASVIVIAALACRFTLQMQLDRALRLHNNSFWMGPFRDILSCAVFFASFFGRAVEWRGHRYAVLADNTLAYTGEVNLNANSVPSGALV
jgi:ceramide glucosyltransferase